MIRLQLRALASLAIVAALTACDTRAPGDASDPASDPSARAAYSREMVFIAADATGAALLDFSAADVGSAVRRASRAWAEAGSGWTPLYDLAWEGTAVRRPWRLVPHGPVRIRVGLGDEVEAISVREEGEDLASVETGDFIAEWSPLATTQVILREATLSLGGDPIRGWLVDARFGVTRQAADDTTGGFAPPAATGAATIATDAAADSGVAADTATPPAGPPTPLPGSSLAVRGVRGVLVGPDGETLVIGRTDTGLAGWFWTVDGETTVPTLTLSPLQGERGGWAIAGAALSGSVEVMDEEPLPVSPRIVRGTIEVDGTSLDVHGVLRPDDVAN